MSETSKNLFEISSLSINNNMNPQDMSASMIYDRKNEKSRRNGTEQNRTERSKAIPIQQPIRDNSDDEIDEFEDHVDRLTAETPPDPFINIQARTRMKWVEDKNAVKCPLCNGAFGMLFRKHHCRLCGDVFCATCSNYWLTIPECITHVPTITGLKADIDRTTPMRMCKTCNDKVILIKKLEILLKSLEKMDIFAFQKITKELHPEDTQSDTLLDLNDFPDISNMEENKVITIAKEHMNGKLWVQLSNLYLSKFREIQYKLLYEEYTEWEKSTLWANYKHLKGHDVWMVHLIRAFADNQNKLQVIVEYLFDNEESDENVVMKERSECWDRMCTRLCQQKLSWESALMLLNVVTKDHSKEKNKELKLSRPKVRNIISREIVKAFDRCDDELLENNIHAILHNLVYHDHNEILLDFVIKRCNTSLRLANKVYWTFTNGKEINQNKCNKLLNRLTREIPKQIYDNIVGINDFVQAVKEGCVKNADGEFYIRDLGKIKKGISPTHPERGEQRVSKEMKSAEISANKPIPIILSPGTDMENKEIYKLEDLRTDMIIISLIKINKRIVEETLGRNLNVVTYDVQPTGLNSGFIGAVSNCETLYKIEEKLGLTLTNYMNKHNPDTSIKEVRERFLTSCAFYTVMTFLLGIGDRHLDNIMLTERGELFHIDYGFILGKDPRPMKAPCMRISQGMLDAIGGFQSEEYSQFKDLCYQIYEISRRHVNTFVCLLSLLPKENTGGTRTNPKVSDNRIIREIIRSFAPGETYERAKTILDTRIDLSTCMTNRSKYHVVDFFHRHNKEGTIRNVVGTAVEYGWSGTSNIVSGIWDYLSYK